MKIMAMLGNYPKEEHDRRAAAMTRAASETTQVDFSVIEESVFFKGLTNLHRVLAAPALCHKAIEAEKAGYDAIVPYGCLDLGVEESRHVVSIPVVGPGRAAVHTARVLCDRFGVICYDEPHVVMFRRLLPQWGVEEHATSIRPVDVGVTEMKARRDYLRERFLELSRKVIREEGAEIILPLGFSMVPLTLDAQDLTSELDVPVLDPMAIAMRLAETLAATGVKNSRVAYPFVDFK